MDFQYTKSTIVISWRSAELKFLNATGVFLLTVKIVASNSIRTSPVSPSLGTGYLSHISDNDTMIVDRNSP